jgi:hypothetical protein
VIKRIIILCCVWLVVGSGVSFAEDWIRILDFTDNSTYADIDSVQITQTPDGSHITYTIKHEEIKGRVYSENRVYYGKAEVYLAIPSRNTILWRHVHNQGFDAGPFYEITPTDMFTRTSYFYPLQAVLNAYGEKQTNLSTTTP